MICYDFCYVLSCQNSPPKYSTSRRLSVPDCPNTLFILYRSAFGGGSGGRRWARSLPVWGMKSLPQKRTLRGWSLLLMTFDYLLWRLISTFRRPAPPQRLESNLIYRLAVFFARLDDAASSNLVLHELQFRWRTCTATIHFLFKKWKAKSRRQRPSSQ